MSEETSPPAKKDPQDAKPEEAPVPPPITVTHAPEPPAGPGPLTPSAGAKSSQQLLSEARAKADAFVASTGRPAVDKYFGSKLPPVCRQLGCYVTDDGKFFYCINPHCHKDKKRETKYNRRRKSVVYFFCPKCKSREIQLHLKANNYECLDCAYTWKH